ncbi:MAG: Hsp70 family protein, partial [Planctomycetales bacterium]|nr:Hsp70 family protein [Planctomycetales bacterium]
MSAEFVVGIDLGTTNSVVAYCRLDAETPDVKLLNIPQLVAADAVEGRPSLPSFLYLAREHEAAAFASALPWNSEPGFVIGEFARQQAAEHPERTIAAAKSWLAHASVDRRAKILPWQAPDEVAKISPVEATRRYLQHLVAAWNDAFSESPLDQQMVVLTVPASFDASARELTREAALEAGLPANLVLLEEPQAAVYAWLADEGDGWRKHVNVSDRVLVCDVGGGTTDLSMIGVADDDGDLSLQRIAVGRHLLVGGDNMDLALAHFVAAKFGEQGVQLNPWDSVSLWHSCRTAKESLLAEDGKDSHKISILGRGRSVIGGTKSLEVERTEVAALLTDGFFPLCEATDRPLRQRQSGFQQMGLPYETDTAVTKHVAAFVHDHQPADQPDQAPTHVLFNGGVFRSEALRNRMLAAFANWFPTPLVDLRSELTERNASLDQAVACGAAFYGWSKHSGAIRIRGGTARSYYIGVETAGLAIPGAPRPLKALCVVPFGMEEGTQTDVPSQEIGVVLGEPATFRFFSSSVRKEDQPGQTLSQWTEDELSETDSMEAELPAGA